MTRSIEMGIMSSICCRIIDHLAGKKWTFVALNCRIVAAGQSIKINYFQGLGTKPFNTLNKTVILNACWCVKNGTSIVF